MVIDTFAAARAAQAVSLVPTLFGLAGWVLTTKWIRIKNLLFGLARLLPELSHVFHYFIFCCTPNILFKVYTRIRSF